MNLSNLSQPKIHKWKKWQNLAFFEKSIFQISIHISVIFHLQGFVIPQIKAKEILFGPYLFTFLATINIFWERKRQICLIFLTETLCLWGRASQNFKHEKLKWDQADSYSLRKRNAEKCENYKNGTILLYYTLRLCEIGQKGKIYFIQVFNLKLWFYIHNHKSLKK